MTAHVPSVLVFDSGVGGLSIAAEIRKLLPQVAIRYLMDDDAFPYGIKEDSWLEQRILTICLDAEARLQPDLLVIACNTASTLALQRLREHLNIPVVGVVPAIKTAAQQTTTGVIGLLATPATVSRPYTDRLQADFASHCTLLRMGSTELVRWAEELIHNGRFSGDLQQHLQPWLSTGNPSHVVLGCTHFPLLRPWLEQLWPDIGWVDSGAAIARRVATLLANQQACEAEHPHPPIDTAGPALFDLHWTSSLPDYPGVQRFIRSLQAEAIPMEN